MMNCPASQADESPGCAALRNEVATTRDDGVKANKLAVVSFGVVGGLGALLLIGGGRACLNDERLDRCVNRAAMFVAEPELSLTFAVTRVLRLVLSGGYRVAVAQAWSGPADRQLSGLTGTLGFQLGKF